MRSHQTHKPNETSTSKKHYKGCPNERNFIPKIFKRLWAMFMIEERLVKIIHEDDFQWNKAVIEESETLFKFLLTSLVNYRVTIHNLFCYSFSHGVVRDLTDWSVLLCNDDIQLSEPLLWLNDNYQIVEIGSKNAQKAIGSITCMGVESLRTYYWKHAMTCWSCLEHRVKIMKLSIISKGENIYQHYYPSNHRYTQEEANEPNYL